MLLTQLPTDVLDRILVCILDLKDLRSFVKASRKVYDVFITRKGSIINAVAKNMIIPEPPQALDVCPFEKGTRLAREVARHAQTVDQLEVLYGLRCATIVYYDVLLWMAQAQYQIQNQVLPKLASIRARICIVSHRAVSVLEAVHVREGERSTVSRWET